MSDTSTATESPPTRDTPGAKLEAERRRQGLSIPDIARHLKLAPRQVEALENDQYNALPGLVFVRGFMRNYARALNLDPVPLVRAAEQTMGVSAAELPMSGPTTIGKPTIGDGGSSRRGGGSRSWVSGLVIAALLAAVIGYFLFNESFQKVSGPAATQSATPAAAPAGEATSASVAAPAASATPPASAPADATANASVAPSAQPAAPAETAAASAPTEAAAPASDKPEMRFSFTKQSWVEIKDKTNKVIFSKPTDPGGERVISGTPPFKVKVGNSSGVKLVYNGKEIDLKPHRRTNDVAFLVLE